MPSSGRYDNASSKGATPVQPGRDSEPAGSQHEHHVPIGQREVVDESELGNRDRRGPVQPTTTVHHLSPVRIEGPSAGRHREPRARHSRTTCPRSPAIRRRTVAHPLRKGSTLVDIVTEGALKHITGPPPGCAPRADPGDSSGVHGGRGLQPVALPARHMTHADVAAYVTNAIYRPDSRGSAVELRDPSGQQRSERRPRRVRSQRGARSRIRLGRPARQIRGTGGE